MLDEPTANPRRCVLDRFQKGQTVSLLIENVCVGTATLFIPTPLPPDEKSDWDELEIALRSKFNRRVHGCNLNEVEMPGQVLLSVRNCVFAANATSLPVPYAKPGSDNFQSKLGDIGPAEFYVWDAMCMDPCTQ